ncbi:hypothetical protein F8M41_023800 [Gigaspora margarita]|uniref:Uncharacterized protein n=1 Tax=Gigaspora margarita TaxID=4874 RepID=A0A8H4EH06_GIGMA|nr:hypothetical protein F8M41_023800 [Gigaspora margarita]
MKLFENLETYEIEWEDQEVLLEDSNEAENEPEDNNSTSSIAFSSSSLDNDDDSKKETDKNDEELSLIASAMYHQSMISQ